MTGDSRSIAFLSLEGATNSYLNNERQKNIYIWGVPKNLFGDGRL